METYFIADTHFLHKNIISFDGRPWDSVEEMTEGLIERWNGQVKGHDHVYVLGDFCWSAQVEQWAEILKRLKGHKHLVTGNHDPRLKTNSNFYRRLEGETGKRGFESVREQDLLKNVSGLDLVLSHYYLANYEHSYDPYRYMLYGHSHDTHEQEMLDEITKLIQRRFLESGNMYGNRGQLISVSACRPYMGYTPQSIDYLIEKGF